ncbi:hypothetical protein DFJ73DRAFT_825435 [Zopfochytrium polystomum]|nr:hypothetical protein DFJ73DRAFT_825435 [Zopfochytrium polystomum]
MADFDDDEILALAGADSTQKSTKRKRSQRREPSEEPEEGEAFDDDIDEDDEDDGGAENEEELREIERWGDDLMGDDEDRRRLMAMTDLEREGVIAERAEKRQEVLDRLELRKKVFRERQHKQDSKEKDRRVSSRKFSERSKLSKYFSDLRRQRDEKTSKRSMRGSEAKRSDAMQYSDNEDEADDRSPPPEDYSRAEEVEEAKVTMEQIGTITLTRKELEGWAFTSFFAETVIGCFVRIGLGYDSEKRAQYRLAQISDVVDYHKPYYVETVLTKKALQCSHGRAKKVFTMDVVSNQAVTEQEFWRYVKTMEVEREQMVSPSMVAAKLEDLTRARNHILTSEELEGIVAAKQALQKTPHNIASEKIMLKRKLDEAIEQDDTEQVELLQAELQKLDEATEKRRGGAAKAEVKVSEKPAPTLETPEKRKPLSRITSFATIPEAPLATKPVVKPRRHKAGSSLNYMRIEEQVFANDPFLDSVVI